MIKYHWLNRNHPIICVTSTRLGGISKKPYESLNLAYHVSDNPDNVTKNRKRFCNEIGISMDSLVLANQVHGDRIEIIKDEHAGYGAFGIDNAIPDTDAMITNSCLVGIGILTADCVPVMIYDPINSVIGVVHAGWKGAVLMIAGKTVNKMKEVFGTSPSDCMVVYGASIRACCYKVGDEVASQFDDAFGKGICIKRDRLDLPKSIDIQLADIGVKKENILSDDTCTACNLGLYYSHRAENGITGRMMSLIMKCK